MKKTIVLIILLFLIFNFNPVSTAGTSNVETENSEIDNGLTSRAPTDSTTKRSDVENYKWQYTEVAKSEDIYGDISLAIDSKDNPHLLYFTKSHGYYSYFNGIKWKNEMIIKENFSYPQCILVLDNSDYPYVCLATESYDLIYGFKNDTGWHLESIAQNYSSYPDLDVDSEGYPHIVYRGSGARLYYQYFNGTDWIKTIFDDVKDCYGATIKIDSNDHPHISCSNRGKDEEADELKYFYHNGEFWNNITVPGIPSFTETNLELDENNHPHIFYMRFYGYSLNYIYFNGVTWIDNLIGNINGVMFSSQLSSNGLPYYSNRDSDYNIRLYRFNGTAWKNIYVGSKGYVSSKSYFKLDSEDNLHLVFLLEGSLIYTTKFYETVPPVANAGKDITIDQLETVVLNGSTSTDNVGISNYTWIIPGKPHYLRHYYGQKIKYTFNDYGTFNIKLKVLDYCDNRATDEVVITVRVFDITPPVADAGENLSINSGERVTFNASGSVDNIEILNYTWIFEYNNTDFKFYGLEFCFTFHIVDVYEITFW